MREIEVKALRDQSIAKYWKHRNFDKGMSERTERPEVKSSRTEGEYTWRAFIDDCNKSSRW